jgi:hypothetical protein
MHGHARTVALVRDVDSHVQDEWNFFNPQKCGFAALLAKLEETTDQEDGPAQRQA